ncbi:hypothetical protein TNCV_1880091 [Trichonephila clavipes]|nr:hypothetical protein TNCV_1880091 [Trichonephila clavipes]
MPIISIERYRSLKNSKENVHDTFHFLDNRHSSFNKRSKTRCLTWCKEQLPAPGNRSNERRDREKDLATTGEKKGRNGREERGRRKKAGVVKRGHG